MNKKICEQRGFHVLLFTVLAMTMSCGFQQIRAENTTHPVMVGPVERLGDTTVTQHPEAGSVPIHVEYSDMVAAGYAVRVQIPASKMDALVLSSLKSDKDVVKVREISMKTYFLSFFPIVAGGSSEINTQTAIQRPAAAEAPVKKGKGGK